jgi:hypothetical protein
MEERVAEVFNSFELIFTKDADGHYTVMDSGGCAFLPMPQIATEKTAVSLRLRRLPPTAQPKRKTGV